MMNDGAQDTAELEQLRAQRAQLADRLRAPWWYLPVFTVGMALICAVPIGTHYVAEEGNWSTIVALVLFYLLQQALARSTGVAVSRTLRYPSGRAAGIAMMAVVVAALVAEWLLLRHAMVTAAIVAAVLATVIAAVCQQAHLRGIRHDLRTCYGAL